ncbi:hypothetical protein PPGU19_093520 (plasmid) [Paraburkholderia sp. PGU19]|nr:hypothetical protein PPGU19_093520 [Paraburkholderia sp. PGU19]
MTGTPSHPRGLENSHHRIIGFSWGRAGNLYPLVMHRRGETVKVQSRYALAVDDGNAYLAAGLAGLGIPWLPRDMSEAHLRMGELVALFEDWQLASLQIASIEGRRTDANPPSNHPERDGDNGRFQRQWTPHHRFSFSGSVMEEALPSPSPRSPVVLKPVKPVRSRT